MVHTLTAYHTVMFKGTVAPVGVWTKVVLLEIEKIGEEPLRYYIRYTRTLND
jgi:hypothetical protein